MPRLGPASALLALTLLLLGLAPLQLAAAQTDIDEYLREHNTFRARHRAEPLVWSRTLANAAQTWADRCQTRHSFGSVGNYGENLAWGTGNYSIATAIKSWTDESSRYDPRNPQPSHFTQVVWKSTRELGCAVNECWGIFDPRFGPVRLYVCEYSPPGNIFGEFQQNVTP